MTERIHSKVITEAALTALQNRGVTLQDIAEIVYDMQIPYNKQLTMADCLESVESVLRKREVQFALLVGIELDTLAERKLLSEPLQSLIEKDEPLFGIDETVALGAVLSYGSIAMTTYGHLDKQKTGIIKRLDTKNGTAIHTFLDDLVGSIAANAASRIAHQFRDEEDAH